MVEGLPVAGEFDVNSCPVDLFEESDSGGKGGSDPSEVGSEVVGWLVAVMDFGVVCLGDVPGVGLAFPKGI